MPCCMSRVKTTDRRSPIPFDSRAADGQSAPGRPLSGLNRPGLQFFLKRTYPDSLTPERFSALKKRFRALHRGRSVLRLHFN